MVDREHHSLLANKYKVSLSNPSPYPWPSIWLPILQPTYQAKAEPEVGTRTEGLKTGQEAEDVRTMNRTMSACSHVALLTSLVRAFT